MWCDLTDIPMTSLNEVIGVTNRLAGVPECVPDSLVFVLFNSYQGMLPERVRTIYCMYNYT